MGELHHDNKVIASATKTFSNDKKVGIKLNMETATATFFIDGEKVLRHVEKKWLVTKMWKKN